MLGPDQPLDPGATLSELGLDSLEMVGLMTTLESHDGFAFPDGDLTAGTFDTPGTLWAVVEPLRPR